MLLAVLIAIIIIILTGIVFKFWLYRERSRRGVLLMGLSDCGKTLIFARILHNQFVNTFTSIKDNAGEYTTQTDSLKLIDIPGHERVRVKFFDQYKSSARGIVYVVDSVTFQKDIRDVAEFLYNLLTDPIIISNCPEFLVACNKQDCTMAKGSSVVKKLLEKELNTLRKTKSSQLQSLSNSSERTVFLGKEDKDFEFHHLRSIKVDFAECSAGSKENAADLSQLSKWLNRIA